MELLQYVCIAYIHYCCCLTRCSRRASSRMGTRDLYVGCHALGPALVRSSTRLHVIMYHSARSPPRELPAHTQAHSPARAPSPCCGMPPRRSHLRSATYGAAPCLLLLYLPDSVRRLDAAKKSVCRVLPASATSRSPQTTGPKRLAHKVGPPKLVAATSKTD